MQKSSFTGSCFPGNKEWFIGKMNEPRCQINDLFLFFHGVKLNQFYFFTLCLVIRFLNNRSNKACSGKIATAINAFNISLNAGSRLLKLSTKGSNSKSKNSKNSRNALKLTLLSTDGFTFIIPIKVTNTAIKRSSAQIPLYCNKFFRLRNCCFTLISVSSLANLSFSAS